MAGNKKRTISLAPMKDDWEAQDAFRTLCRAEEVKKDKKLMERVRKHAASQLEATACVLSEAKEGKE